MDDDGTEKMIINNYWYSTLKKKFEELSQILDDLNSIGNNGLYIQKLLQDCIEIFNTGKDNLEYLEKGTHITSSIVNELIIFQKGVILSFKHCSKSNIIYSDSIDSVKSLLIELFKNTSNIQTLVFNILEKVEFDFTLEEDLKLIINALKHIWYGAEAVYNASYKIMTANWRIYINLSQKFPSTLKKYIINDEPIHFLCTEMKQKISSLQYDDETTLKLITYMMSVLLKLCLCGHLIESHNTLVDFVLFLNSYWLYDTQDTKLLKNKLYSYGKQLVLNSDEMFMKTFQSFFEDINSHNSVIKMSALNIAVLLLERLCKSPCEHQAYEIILLVFQIVRCTDCALCAPNTKIYEPLLIHIAAVVIVSKYSLFEKVEQLLFQSIISTDYWPVMLSSDLWMSIMRFLSPENCNLQFCKLAQLFEELIAIPCFIRCPQYIYIESLLRRHYKLITNKIHLENNCLQLKNPKLKSVLGILHIPTLSKYNKLSELTDVLSILPDQKYTGHLNNEIIYLWSCIKNEFHPNYLCALIEITIGSEYILKAILPKCITILNYRGVNDTTAVKHCKLRLIQSILLHSPSFEDKLIMNIFLDYLSDRHPFVRQWTIETIVYFVSVTVNKNNLISMLFKRSEIRTIITNYLEMKVKRTYTFDERIQYFDKLSLRGKFKHSTVCLYQIQLKTLLDKLKQNIDCVNNAVSRTQISKKEFKRLKEYSNVLNNICEATQMNVENI